MPKDPVVARIEAFATELTNAYDPESGDPLVLDFAANSMWRLFRTWVGDSAVPSSGPLATEALAIRDAVRAHSSDAERIMFRGLENLARYYSLKAKAARFRLKGSIAAAARVEAEAESAYRSLPTQFRW